MTAHKEHDTPEETIDTQHPQAEETSSKGVEQSKPDLQTKIRFYGGIGLSLLGFVFAAYQIIPIIYGIFTEGVSVWQSESSSDIACGIGIAATMVAIGNLALSHYRPAIIMTIVAALMFLFSS